MYPILFEFGPITVFSLWLFVAIGFAAGSMLFVKLAKRYRLRLDLLSDNSFLLFFWTLLVSRAAFILFHPEYYFYRFQFKKIFDLFALWDKGLSFWGASFAWFAGIWYISRKRGESALRLFDIMIPSLLLGMFFGNIGAFFDGINYGSPTDLPWGFTFRSANVKYISDIHPTQLYGAAYVLIISLGLLAILKMLRGKFEGFVSEIAIFAFCLFRFLEEFARGDEVLKIFFIRFPQFMAGFGLLISGYILYKRYKNTAGGSPLENLFKNKIASLRLGLAKKFRKPNPAKMTAGTISFQTPSPLAVRKT